MGAVALVPYIWHWGAVWPWHRGDRVCSVVQRLVPLALGRPGHPSQGVSSGPVDLVLGKTADRTHEWVLDASPCAIWSNARDPDDPSTVSRAEGPTIGNEMNGSRRRSSREARGAPCDVPLFSGRRPWPVLRCENERADRLPNRFGPAVVRLGPAASGSERGKLLWA